MPKKGSSSGSDANAAIQELVPRIEAVTSSIFTLTSTNYRLWAMRMEVYLEAHGLWEAITGTETNRKKDRQALSAILNSVSESVSFQLDVKKTAKENWETIRTLHVGVDHVVQSKIQSLRREFENLAMKKDEKVSEFSSRFTKIISELRDLGERLEEKEAVAKLLRSMPMKYDSLTFSLEQFGNMRSLSVDEVIGSLRVHEQRLQERDSREEEQVLLARAYNQSKKTDHGSSSRGRGRGTSRGRGRGRGRGRFSKNDKEEEERKPFDKSKVKCYNCQKMGHFTDECYSDTKKKGKEEKVNISEETEEESALMMVMSDECGELLLQGTNNPHDECMWYLDTGASSHMTGKKVFFDNIDESKKGKVRFGDGSSIPYEGKGDISVTLKTGEVLTILNVLYLPDLKTNILSLEKLDEQGCKTSLSSGFLTVHDKSGRFLTKTKRTSGNMYKMMININERCNLIEEEASEAWLWHKRFCHQSFYTLQDMIRGDLVKGLPKFRNPNVVCAHCISGKHSRTSFSSSSYRALSVLELLHMDICGPINPQTLGGKRYFFLIVDDYSRCMWVALLKEKSEAFEQFKKFKTMAEAEKGVKIKSIRSDRGGEFTSDEFRKLCDESGIRKQLTAPYTPQQNGVVERRNRKIMGLVRSMLKEKELPLELWGEAVSTCVYVLNRSSTKGLEGKTPYEQWNGRKPNVSHLRIFGSIVFVKTTGRLSKLEDRSKCMVLMGYEAGSKAYRCLDPENFRIHISRDVIFDEKKTFKFSEEGNLGKFTLCSSNYLKISGLEEGERDSLEEQSGQLEVNESRGRDLSQPEDSEEEEAVRYRSIQSIYNETNLLCSEICFLFNEEPSSYSSAAKQKEWKVAMEEEMSSILKNETWTMVKPQSDIKPIGVKWVFRVKKDSKGRILRHKARLVVKGYAQKEGINYSEVFSPVARMDSIRILIAIAAQEEWELHHLDVKTAFLNGEIKEDIYITQPEGFEVKGKEDHILKLKKALYGLKQAPRAWNSRLNEVLLKQGFVRSKCDYGVYYTAEIQEKIIIGVYVDDMIITGSKSHKIMEFKEGMKKVFEMTDLGILSSYLGIEIKYEEDYTWLTQRSYIESILHSFKMSECNSVKTPMEARLKLGAERENDEVNPSIFRSLIGSLRYLLNSRPDLTYSVNYLSRFMSKPSSEHMNAAKRVLRYIKGTSSFGLRYERGMKKHFVQGFSDSDFAGDKFDRESTSGQVFFIGNSAITWNSVKQGVVALSSCEAEYISASAASCQGIWIIRLIEELLNKKVSPFKSFVDNVSAISLSKNPSQHGRSKHIDTKFHFIRDCVEKGYGKWITSRRNRS